MLIIPTPTIPRAALAVLLFAVTQSALAQNSTTPTPPVPDLDPHASASISAQQDPCGRTMSARPGAFRARFGNGPEQSIGLDLRADLVPLGMLSLNSDQRARISAIQGDLCTRHFDLANRIAMSKGELRKLYAAEQRDTPAIDRTYKELFSLQRQAIEAEIDAHERIKAVLTPEQRAALNQFPRGPAGIGPTGEPNSRTGERRAGDQ